MSDPTSKPIDQVLATNDLVRQSVYVKEWDCLVWVRAMSADERADLEKRYSGKSAANDPGGFRADLLRRTLVDEAGKQWGTPDQITALMQKNASAVETVFEKSCAVNGLTRQDVEDLKKN